MSRIGKKPITIPKGVTVTVVDGAVEVQGPKGKLRQAHPAGINFELSDGHLVAKRVTDNPELAKFHGLARSLVANAVTQAVVDRLEVVEIDEEHGHQGVGSPPVSQSGLGASHEGGAVGQAGEGVVGRLVLQQVLERAELDH